MARGAGDGLSARMPFTMKISGVWTAVWAGLADRIHREALTAEAAGHRVAATSAVVGCELLHEQSKSILKVLYCFIASFRDDASLDPTEFGGQQK